MKNLFVVGDSISVHYGIYLCELVKPYFDYGRKGDHEEAYNDPNIMKGPISGSSNQLLAYLNEKQSTGFHTDILLLNCGLHDIKKNKITQKVRVSLEDYENNLQEIINIGEKNATSTVRITTTLHDEKRHNTLNSNNDRYEKENEEYHQKALQIMSVNHIPIIDLRTFTQGLSGDLIADHIHFTEVVQKQQAQFILEWLIERNYHL